ncbi:MAG: tetratricopeptide repeat protein [Cyclobacteriaceae bacterium]|nr:tetratricopeptide repeat protein [Cyclobacteriaceae bacterium]
MKRVFIFIGIILAGSSFAQKKPKIGQAESAVLSGDVKTAMAITDEGIVHEKTKNDPKTWFIRGLALGIMDTSGVEGGDMAAAVSALHKANDLKKGNSELFIGPITSMVMYSGALQSFWAYNLNKGVAAFQNADERAAALDYFEKSTLIMPDSLDAYYYAGLAGVSIEEYDRALKNFKSYIDKGGNEEDSYIKAIYILNQINEDNESALELVRKAKVKYPESKIISEWEFKVLFAMDKVGEAVVQLEEQIERDPNNAELHFNLGVMKDQMGKTEESKVHYENALKVDPKYFNALFNLGVYYRNQLVEKSKEKNNLGISKADIAKGKKLDSEITELSKKALPYWEKCRELKADDQTTLETLQYIYVQLKDYDKAEEVMSIMEELGYR